MPKVVGFWDSGGVHNFWREAPKIINLYNFWREAPKILATKAGNQPPYFPFYPPNLPSRHLKKIYPPIDASRQ